MKENLKLRAFFVPTFLIRLLYATPTLPQAPPIYGPKHFLNSTAAIDAYRPNIFIYTS